jgi:hypothetical protein
VAGQALDRGREPALGQRHRVDPARELAQLLVRRGQLLLGRRQQLGRRAGVVDAAPAPSTLCR